MRQLLLLAGSSLLIVGCSSAAARPTPAPAPATAPVAASATTRSDGFIPVLVDAKTGKIFLELPRDSMRALMWTTLATGLGSNPVGLDRGANGGEYVVRFDKVGERVLVVFENWAYRSTTGDAAHVRSVAESFPTSTVA